MDKQKSESTPEVTRGSYRWFGPVRVAVQHVERWYGPVRVRLGPITPTPVQYPAHTYRFGVD